MSGNTLLGDLSRQCKYVGVEPVFWKTGDTSEYYDERGFFYENREVTCRAIADSGERFCPRHILLNKERKPVERYECHGCHQKRSTYRALCHCGGGLYEIPVEIPL